MILKPFLRALVPSVVLMDAFKMVRQSREGCIERRKTSLKAIYSLEGAPGPQCPQGYPGALAAGTLGEAAERVWEAQLKS